MTSADVHMLLGDLSSENDAFADALEDYRVALHLLSKHLPEVWESAGPTCLYPSCT